MIHTLYIGSDHAGFKLKSHLIHVLHTQYEIIDCGPHEFIKGDDYPTYAKIVCEKVIEHKARGILICDTGIGMSIAANRYEEIRAGLVVTPFMAERTRLHNDSNIICLGEALLTLEENEALVRMWLQTDFDGAERNIRRISQLSMLG